MSAFARPPALDRQAIGDTAPRSVLRPSRVVLARHCLTTVWMSVRRNLPLAGACIATSAVALALIGVSLLVSAGVDNATIRWRGGVETIVFLDPEVADERAAEIGEELTADPAVASATFVDQEQAYAEFETLYRHSPDLVDSIEPEYLPASWRIVPSETATPEEVTGIGAGFIGQEGVYDVIYAQDAVDAVISLSLLVQRALVGAAIVLGAAALILAWTTSRAAVHARADELSIMRSLGAPRWVVRVPFIAEGSLLGLAGGLIGAAVTVAMAATLQDQLASGMEILRGFAIDDGHVVFIAALVGGGGAIGGALGAALAIHTHGSQR